MQNSKKSLVRKIGDLGLVKENHLMTEKEEEEEPMVESPFDRACSKEKTTQKIIRRKKKQSG